MGRKRKKLAEYGATPSPAPDARTGEAAERVLCTACGVSIPLDEAQKYLPASGGVKLRCLDCATARKTAPEPVPLEVAETEGSDIEANAAHHAEVEARQADDLDDLAARYEHVKAAREALADELEAAHKELEAAQKDAKLYGMLRQRICGLGVPGAPVAKDATFPEVSNVLDHVYQDWQRLRDVARGASTVSAAELAEAREQVDTLIEELAQAREAHEQEREALVCALDQRRKLEVLLGLDAPEGSEAIAPWMYDLGVRLVNAAPDQIDAQGLAALIAEGIHTAFFERTYARARAHEARVSGEIGAALEALRRSADEVENSACELPDEPPEEKCESIEAAWSGLNAAAAHARDVVFAERDRLRQIEAQRRFARPQLVERTIEVRRTPEPEREEPTEPEVAPDEPMGEDEDEEVQA